MKNYLLYILLAAVTTLALQPAAAQSRNAQYEAYIDRYAALAQEHQRLYGIPASITLAQGLLESAAGLSDLTRKANNHFGIKCHDWKGDGINYKGDCYRKYRKPEDSYYDHSQFLLRSRYARLFKLSLTDYKGWARGLKECGYATDPSYAPKLIRIIELYDLNQYVTAALDGKKKKEKKKKKEQQEQTTPAYPQQPTHIVYRSWGLLYVEAREGDTYESIAGEYGFRAKDLARYNDSKTKATLHAGDIVYLEKKHKKAVEGYEQHTVTEGETLHYISQIYGIELKHLAKRNKMRRDAPLHDGVVLQLR